MNNIIKKEIEKRGITQVQAAFDLDLHRSDFCLIANGYLIPKPEIRANIVEYLGLPEDVLFNQVGKQGGAMKKVDLRIMLDVSLTRR